MAERALDEGVSAVGDVADRSRGFRRELGLGDLVLTQILYVVGSGWVGAAAKLGTSQIAYWVLAILLFYLPQAAVVIYLNRLMPLEGGLYQWAKAGFNERTGFMVAWNVWAFMVILISAFGVAVANTLVYVLGPHWLWLADNKWYDAGVTVALIVGLMLVGTGGLRVGKWVHNAGGAMQLIVFGALIAMPYFALRRGTIASYHPLAATLPAASVLSLNIFGKMAVGALSGLESVAILAGECRNPLRSIRGSVILATPLIAVMFIIGTSAVMAVVPASRIDLISPIPQALLAGLGSFGIAEFIVPLLALLLLVRHVADVNYIFTGNTRLPMVTGWDGMVPGWFTRLHPRFRTPVNSVVFVGAITLALALVSLIGVGLQESFQLLDNAAGILYALSYLAMFAIPIFGLRRLGVRVPVWLKVVAATGFAITVLYVVLSVLPIIDVASWRVFALKIIAVVVGANLVGVALLLSGERRRRARVSRATLAPGV
jgi:amino acid transporter